MTLLEQTRAALSNAHPAASLETVFAEGMKLLVAAHRKRVQGEAKRPRAQRAGTGTRYVARAVRRAVWLRDAGRCTFVAPDGRRCDETHGLHFDHIVPFARGGATTDDNLRLRCATHDALAAREAYGDEHVARAIERARGDG